MPDFTLSAAPFLGGLDQDFGEIRLRELTGLGIVALAIPLGGEARAGAALAEAFGATLPDHGSSLLLEGERLRLVRMGPDQVFAVFPCETPDAEARMRARLGDAFYLTDQSDAWVALEIAGPPVREVLARICPIDLHPDAFPLDAAARTAMEHMGAVIVRTGPDIFLLLSASSSARSFLHAVETSIANVL